ncbi:MAG: 50S ribosomal protein L11 methyltransferase [Armatimonadetes bacterium]|nr:50S ribosomal protein L11 methyltransferase [Armatimonadota bacterium]
MSVWKEVKAILPQAPLDWSTWDEVFERHGIHGTVQTDEPPTLAGFLSPDDMAKLPDLDAELRELGATDVELRDVPEVDWAEAWKQFFVPRRIGERFVVVPSWEDYSPEPGNLVITLDPGQAFGTGDHPTTRGCLELLEKVGCAGKEIADIGCGSGILTVGAALLGARSLVAVDVEAVCVRSTLENLERNGGSAEVFQGLGFDPLPSYATFDLVVSNIISAALIGLAPQAAGRVRSGGHWIVSGIIHENWPDVEAKARSCGFATGEVFREGDWVAAVFSR